MKGFLGKRASPVACAALAVVAMLAVPAAAAGASTCNGSADLCQRPFNEAVFAGTHNSMAADDYGWSSTVTTQTHTITRQLENGVRALSLDVWYGSRGAFGIVSKQDGPTRPGVEPYLCHNVCQLGALRLASGFREVVSFLNANPNEVLAIYFEDYASVGDIRAVLDSSGLMPFVHSGPLNQTLGQMIASGKRVVLISQNVSTANQTAWYPRLTSVGRDTDYDFDSTSKLTDPGNLARSCQPTPWGASGTGRFFVMQHFVTNVFASRSASRTVNARDVLARRALACRDARGVLPSVLLVDYYELGDLQGAVRELNSLYRAPVAGAPSGGSGNGAPGEGSTGDGGTGDGTTGDDGAGDGLPSESRGGTGAIGELRLSTLARSVRRGGSARLVLSVYNRSTRARPLTVRLRGGRGDGLRYPRIVRVRVPAQSTPEADILVRAGRDASRGPVRLLASYGKLTSRVTLAVR
ncbi:MAG: hypothetical protein ACKOTH_09950 [Solirubrobacterales bacterium]